MCVAAIAVFFIFSVPASAQKKENQFPIRNCGTLNNDNPFRIIGFKNYPPFSWAELDKNNNSKIYTYHGFILDPLKQSLKDIKIMRTQDIVLDDFNEVLKTMLHGKADLLFTGYYVDEGRSGLDYIYPAYFGNPFIVLSISVMAKL